MTRPGDRRLDVQGLRGIAVLVVVVFHAGVALPGGFVGVDAFFVVSGFVITRLLLRELRTTGTISLREFYARRARRLLPLLAVVLVATSVAGFLFLDAVAARATAVTAAAAALFNANNHLGRQATGYFDLAPTANALLHTWSLSVEEQFYFVVPAALLLAWRWGGRRAFTGTVVAGIVASGALAVVSGGGGLAGPVGDLGFTSPQTFHFYAAPARAWEFLAGALVACAEPRLAGLPGRLRGGLGLVGLALLGFAVVAFDGTRSFTAAHAAVPVAGAALLLLPGTVRTHDVSGPGRLARILATPALTWIGDRSYAWYLLHWPAIVVTRTFTDHPLALGAAAVGSLAASDLAHRVVEDRFRFDRRLRGRRALGLAAACVLLPVAASVAVVVANDRLTTPELVVATGQHFVYTPECLGHDRTTGGLCRIPAPGATRSLFLVGDSHAAQWSEAMRSAAADLGADLTIATGSSCPTLPGLTVELNGAVLDDCTARNDEVVGLVLAESPDVVVFAMAGPRYLEVDDEEVSTRFAYGDLPMAGDPDDEAAVLGLALGDLLARLDAAGIATIVVRDNPYPAVAPTACGRLREAIDGCRADVVRATAEAYRARADALLTTAAEGRRLVTFLDPMATLCTPTACPNTLDGTWLYRDDHHVSIAASLHLGPAFRDAIATALPAGSAGAGG